MSQTPLDPVMDQEVAAAPLPTDATLRARKNVFVQFFRFVAFNFRIVKVVTMAHH